MTAPEWLALYLGVAGLVGLVDHANDPEEAGVAFVKACLWPVWFSVFGGLLAMLVLLGLVSVGVGIMILAIRGGRWVAKKWWRQ